MAQTYTLDEAAAKLGISPDELKRRLRDDWKHVRSFRDGPTLRFRANDIDELARTIGAGSDPEVSAAGDELVLPADLDFDSGEKPAPKTPPPHRKTMAADEPLVLGGGDDDVFILSSEDAPKTASGKIKPGGKPDSDVRMEKASKRPPSSADDDESILTEEMQIDLPASSKSGKLTGKSGRLAGDSGKTAKPDSGRIAKADSGKSSRGKAPPAPPPEEDSSDFELSLEPSARESSDEFELSVNDSDEIGPGDPPAPGKGVSGINLGKPSDSGPSLEKKKAPPKPAAGSDDEIDFELSLDAGSPQRLPSGKSGKNLTDSDSEFELTLDDVSSGEVSALGEETGSFAADEPKGDIFETDFEIPAIDDASGSEAVALEDADTDLESSDFDLALDDSDVSFDDSGSEAVVVDEDAPAGRKKLKPLSKRRAEVDEGEVSFDDMELDEGASASAALRGVERDVDEEEEELEPGEVVSARPAQWGALPAALLIPTVFVMFLGGIMGYELLNNMWGYHQPTKPAALIVDNVSDMFGVKPKE